MKPETQSGKNTKQQKEKRKKGCYWNWLEETEIKTFEAWNRDRKN